MNCHDLLRFSFHPQGGVDDELSLTAYVASALLELHLDQVSRPLPLSERALEAPWLLIPRDSEAQWQRSCLHTEYFRFAPIKSTRLQSTGTTSAWDYSALHANGICFLSRAPW